MKFSLSTNWCNRRIESGAEIAELALSLGFEELELGYHTTKWQADDFKKTLDRIPVGSVHAFCPVPISAPQGYPELYPLASTDEESVKMAHLQVTRNVKFAADIGADTVVLHAGRVRADGFFGSPESRRIKRGVKMLGAFRKELESLVPVLEKSKVTLALENLPYLEGFPDGYELGKVLEWDLGGWVKGWYDTGHARVRECRGWSKTLDTSTHPSSLIPHPSSYAGMHLNDVVDVNDDHFAPSFGRVDFAALRDFAQNVRHVVFEPNANVSEDELRKGVAHIRSLWL